MIDFILLVLFVLGLLIGLRRGLILQALHLIGFIISFIIASIYFDELAEKLYMWIPYPAMTDESLWAEFLQSLPIESAFYHGISFAIIFFISKIILQIIASMLDLVASLPILNSVNKILGAVLGFLEVYLLLFVFLYIAVLLPVGMVQEWINDSSIALFMLEKTPYFSGKIIDSWFVDLNSIFSF
ncbi:CvpA family protein [Ornithinibacillus halophilus]|uniref:Uncharacterized membrane protein, required for colicin V production n=1 Tax=Ornithinibacillus halophilus TaxID=930117 RepID=A0A1M5NF25_9BACI|nr:CvpA family protein [Ornithinibacillus halophilus]SHG88072.1 Uncharacterized membrane protein, required for colicin V production [Ornithinibacillus halophilus]